MLVTQCSLNLRSCSPQYQFTRLRARDAEHLVDRHPRTCNNNIVLYVCVWIFVKQRPSRMYENDLHMSTRSPATATRE